MTRIETGTISFIMCCTGFVVKFSDISDPHTNLFPSWRKENNTYTKNTILLNIHITDHEELSPVFFPNILCVSFHCLLTL